MKAQPVNTYSLIVTVKWPADMGNYFPLYDVHELCKVDVFVVCLFSFILFVQSFNEIIWPKCSVRKDITVVLCILLI